MSFDIDLTTVEESLVSDEERLQAQTKFLELKRKVETEGYELTLEDQKDIVHWLRIDRETKFVLNQKPVKVPKEPKAPKVKKPKKLSQKVLGLLALKEFNKEELTEDEVRNRHYTLTGEIL